MWIQIKPMHENVKTELEKLFSLEERIDYILQNFKVINIFINTGFILHNRTTVVLFSNPSIFVLILETVVQIEMCFY